MISRLTICRYKVTIEKEAFLTVRLCLVAVPGTRKGDIERVISDPSSLDQCETYLQTFTGLRKEAAADAAQAAQAVASSNERWEVPQHSVSADDTAWNYQVTFGSEGCSTIHWLVKVS